MAWSSFQRYAATMLLCCGIFIGWYWWWYKPTAAAITYYQKNVQQGDGVQTVSQEKIVFTDSSFELLANSAAHVDESTRMRLKTHDDYMVDQIKLNLKGSYREIYELLEYIMRESCDAVLTSCILKSVSPGIVHAECTSNMYISRGSKK